MAEIIRVVSPVDGRPYVERPLASATGIENALQSARAARIDWRAVPVSERAAILMRAVDAFVAKSDAITLEITRQMGRPIAFAPFEVRGFAERDRHMIGIAETSLADVEVGQTPGFTRFIRRVPLGTVLVIAPWNYPYLTAVNAVFPALMAGNAVILKHSAQTPICAERFAEALQAAGLPGGVFQYLHMSHAATTRVIASGDVDFVSFTGSVAGGHDIQRAALVASWASASSWAARTRFMYAPMPTSSTPSRTWPTAHSSTVANRAAPSSESTCKAKSTIGSWMARSHSQAATGSMIRPSGSASRTPVGVARSRALAMPA